MIVIAKRDGQPTKKQINIRDDSDAENENDMQFDNEEKTIEVEAIKVKILKMIAINEMEFNVYHYSA